MRVLEIVLIVGLLLLLLALTLRGVDRRSKFVLFAIAAAAFAASLVLGQLRWQMMPAYVLLVVLAPLLRKRSRSHLALRCLGGAAGVVLLSGAAALSLALPIVELPSPNGPYAVGSRLVSLIDESRTDAYFGRPNESRELLLRIWYPGVLPEAGAPRLRTLWQDLYRGPADSIALLAGYLRGIETHTYPDIPLAEDGPFPVLVFSHAQGLFAEQNTLLMEHLASHGYVLIGVNHTHMSLRAVSSRGKVVVIDPERQQEALAAGDALNDETLTRIFASADTPEKLSADLASLAPALSEQLAIRVADLRFVMDRIASRGPVGPARTSLPAQLDPERIGLIGMSFGGTTAMQACKLDSRCRAGLNLDGPLFGDQRWHALEAPFLGMLSEWTEPYYERVLLDAAGPYHEVLVHGAEHGDFFDLTFLLARWLSSSGEISPRRAAEIVNTVSLRFFDAYLRDGPPPRFGAMEFPELRITMNARAAEQQDE